MALENSRIDQLPLGSPSNGDFFVFRDQINGVTKKVLVDQFLTDVDINNFEWSPSPAAYDEDDVVTYSGKWWQSLVVGVGTNIGNVPGVDPTKWIEVNKAAGSSIKLHEAGVYTGNPIIVAYPISGQLYLFRLKDSLPTPYTSTNFIVELENGDWEELGSIGTGTVDVSTMFINFIFLREFDFKASANITAPKTWGFGNQGIGTKRMTFRFRISGGLHAQTMPANVKMLSYSAEWNSATKIWTPAEEGLYLAEGVYDQSINEWLIKISGPYN